METVDRCICYVIRMLIGTASTALNRVDQLSIQSDFGLVGNSASFVDGRTTSLMDNMTPIMTSSADGSAWSTDSLVSPLGSSQMLAAFLFIFVLIFSFLYSPHFRNNLYNKRSSFPGSDPFDDRTRGFVG